MRTRGPGESALLMLDVASILGGESVEYAVIGAMAASVHGLVRASVDADAVVFVSASALSALEKKFQLANFKTELRRGDAEDPIAALLELTDPHGNRVDLLVGLRGLEAAAFSRAIKVPFAGEELRVIGCEDFIAMKAFAGGPQDLADARSALGCASKSLDLALIKRLAARFGPDAAKSLDGLLSELRPSAG